MIFPVPQPFGALCVTIVQSWRAGVASESRKLPPLPGFPAIRRRPRVPPRLPAIRKKLRAIPTVPFLPKTLQAFPSFLLIRKRSPALSTSPVIRKWSQPFLALLASPKTSQALPALPLLPRMLRLLPPRLPAQTAGLTHVTSSLPPPRSFRPNPAPGWKRASAT